MAFGSGGSRGRFMSCDSPLILFRSPRDILPLMWMNVISRGAAVRMTISFVSWSAPEREQMSVELLLLRSWIEQFLSLIHI